MSIIQRQMESGVNEVAQMLLRDREFIQSVKEQVLGMNQKGKSAIDLLVDELKEIITELIHCQLQSELKQLVQDNNRILREIQQTMIRRQPPNFAQIQQDLSFSQVHKLMSEQRHRIQEQVNDASLDKSISAFVELKVQTIQDKLIGIEKRLKGMEDKYETNLNSIWNVLSITQSAIFDHLKEVKQRKCVTAPVINEIIQPEKKSILNYFKFGGK